MDLRSVPAANAGAPGHPRARSFCLAASLLALLAVTPAQATLVTGPDGHFYGTTADGGPAEAGSLPANANGTVYRVTASGDVTVLHTFSINTPELGWQPAPSLTVGPDQQLYGTTERGGEYCSECGTIFRITLDGRFTRLHSFNGTDGASPSHRLVSGSDGRLYGVTGSEATGIATLYSIDTDGEFTLLRSATAESDAVSIQTVAGTLFSTIQTFDPNRLQSPLLDDFNRPNTNSLGDDWTPLITDFATPRLSVSNGEAKTNTSNPRGDYWNERFDADQEVYALFPFNAGYDDIGLAVRYDPATGVGYAMTPNLNGVGSVSLVRIQDNRVINTFLDTAHNVFKDGSWLGIRAVGNQITGWHSADGIVWTRVLQATDDTVQGSGHVAIWLNNEHTIDEVYGGSLDVPPPPPPPPPPDENGDDEDNGDGGDGGDGGTPPDNVDPDIDVPANPITGTPGGGRQGGIGLGATGAEWLVLLLLLPLLRRRYARTDAT